jgi:hypothetical protein
LGRERHGQELARRLGFLDLHGHGHVKRDPGGSSENALVELLHDRLGNHRGLFHGHVHVARETGALHVDENAVRHRDLRDGKERLPVGLDGHGRGVTLLSKEDGAHLGRRALAQGAASRDEGDQKKRKGHFHQIWGCWLHGLLSLI